ncbi:FAD-dependent oxidoreductase [Patescibacteria group bacterium]|nr:FAD-dependent oxidoreductase [Patescibacteria group bacterium]
MKKYRMVVVGGGFAGLTLARTLAADAKCEVTLIDASDHQVYTPWLYEIVAGGLKNAESYIKKLTQGARIPLKSTCQQFGIKFRQGRVISVDRDRKEVRFQDGLTLAYDTLIFACGVQADDFGIEGVQEHTLMLKSLADATKAQHAVRLCAQEALAGKPQTVLVCGAGPNGVECSAEIAHAAKALGIRSLRVLLLEGADRPLKSADPKLSADALWRLKSLGVEVICGARLMSCRSNLAIVKKNDQESHIAFDTCLFTAGTKPHDFVRSLGLALSPRGRILTDGTFQVQGEAHIYALGDCAAMMTSEIDALPQTAQAAHEQASFFGRELLRAVRGGTMRVYQPPKQWYVAVAVGGKYAVADLKVWRTSGYLGFLLRRIADVRYYYAILPWHEASIRLIRSLALYNKNDHA